MSTEQHEGDEDGFRIAGTFYPFPSMFRLCDPVLITEVTGMKFPAFAAAVDEMQDADEEGQDPIVLSGLVAVAVWQKNPRWKRDRVLRFVEQLDFEALETTSGEAAEDNDALPLNGDAPSGD
jgi:hypothetical protein